MTVPAATYAAAVKNFSQARVETFPTPSVTNVAAYVFGDGTSGSRDTVAALAAAAYDMWLCSVRMADKASSTSLPLSAVSGPPTDAVAYGDLMKARWLRALTDVEAMSFGVAMFAFSDGELTRFVRGFIHDDGSATVLVPELRASTMHVQISANAVQYTGVWNAYNDCVCKDGGEFLCYELPEVTHASPQVAPTIGGTRVSVFGKSLHGAAVGQPTFVRFQSVGLVPQVSAVVHGRCVGGGHIECTTPSFGAAFMGTVDVSLNGLQFSGSAGRFQVYALPVVLDAAPKMAPMDSTARLTVDFQCVPYLASGSVRARTVFSVHDTNAHFDELAATAGTESAADIILPQSFVREDVVCELLPPSSVIITLRPPSVLHMPSFVSRIACAVARNTGLEVALDGQNFVYAGNLGAHVKFYSWPVVSTVRPGVALAAGGCSFTITGQGFVRSPELRVRFRGKCGGPSVCTGWEQCSGNHEEVVPAQFVDPSTLTCVCPSWPLGEDKSSVVAIDASVYGGLFPVSHAGEGAATTSSVLLCGTIGLTECMPRCGPLRGGSRVHLYGSGIPRVGSLVVRLEFDSVVEVVREVLPAPPDVQSASPRRRQRNTSRGRGRGVGTAAAKRPDAPSSGTEPQAKEKAVTTTVTNMLEGQHVLWVSDGAVAFTTPRFSFASKCVRVRLSMNGMEYTESSATFEVYEAPALDCVVPYAVPACGGTEVALMCREPLDAAAVIERPLHEEEVSPAHSPRERGAVLSFAAVSKLFAQATVPAPVARAVPFPDTGAIVVRFGDGPAARTVRAIAQTRNQLLAVLPRLAQHVVGSAMNARVRLHVSFNDGHDFEPIRDAPHVPQVIDSLFDTKEARGNDCERKPRYGDEVSVYTAPEISSLDVFAGPVTGGTVVRVVASHMRGPLCRSADECAPWVRFGDNAGAAAVPMRAESAGGGAATRMELTFTAPPSARGRSQVVAGVAAFDGRTAAASPERSGGAVELMAQLTRDKSARAHAAAATVVLPKAVERAEPVPLFVSVDGCVTWVPTHHYFVYFPDNTRVTGASAWRF